MLTVEYRSQTAWDRALPSSAVVIHEVRPDGNPYLLSPSDGPGWQAGQTFLDLGRNMRVSILKIDSASSTAIVNIGLAHIDTEGGGGGDAGNGWTWGNSGGGGHHRIPKFT